MITRSLQGTARMIYIRTQMDYDRQVQPITEKGRQTQSPTPNQEAICNRNLQGKGKSVFSNGVTLGMPIILRGKTPAQEQANTKQTPCSLCLLFQFVLLGIFCLFISIFVWLFFFSPLREIEHEIGRVKKWVGSERSQGRGKNIIKTDFMKCFKIIRKTKKKPIL